MAGGRRNGQKPQGCADIPPLFPFPARTAPTDQATTDPAPATRIMNEHLPSTPLTDTAFAFHGSHTRAVDAKGRPGTDPAEILHNLTFQVGGGILPLGGLGEALGGHKGFGLSVMVDILCGVLSGSAFGSGISDEPGSSARVSHFFAALQIASIRDPIAFRQDMDRMLADLRNSPPAEGTTRVYFAGLKELESEAMCEQRGIPLTRKVYDQLVEVGSAWGVTPPSTM